jgi:hypothetical protein
VPPLLVRQWAFDVYAKLLSGSRWGWQRSVVQHTLAAKRALASITLTPGSATVASAALFLASDVGKQLLVGSEPLLTIGAFVSTSQVTLRSVYSGTSTATAASVLEAFYVPPTGFQQFVLISDRTRKMPIPHWLSLEQIMLWDPARDQAGTPRGLIAHSLQTVTGSGTPSLWYEWWPRNTAGGSYELVMLLGPQTATLTDATELPAPLDDRAYLLKDGVLARCAMFPGTPSQKNPYFNLALAAALETQFQRGRADLAIVNDDQGMDPIVDTIDWRYVRAGGGDQHYQYSDASALDGASAYGGQWYY